MVDAAELMCVRPASVLGCYAFMHNCSGFSSVGKPHAVTGLVGKNRECSVRGIPQVFSEPDFAIVPVVAFPRVDDSVVGYVVPRVRPHSV